MFQRIIDWLYPNILGGAKRSSQWSKVRADHLLYHPFCAVTGKKGTFLNPLEVHHIKSFHEHPELELEPKNLITLRKDMHLLFGHLMNYSKTNIDVVKDSEYFFKKIISNV